MLKPVLQLNLRVDRVQFLPQILLHASQHLGIAFRIIEIAVHTLLVVLERETIFLKYRLIEPCGVRHPVLVWILGEPLVGKKHLTIDPLHLAHGYHTPLTTAGDYSRHQNHQWKNYPENLFHKLTSMSLRTRSGK